MLQHGKQQTIQPGNKRETEISVRGGSARVNKETTSNASVLSASEERGEYDAKCQDKKYVMHNRKLSQQTHLSAGKEKKWNLQKS